MMSSFLCFVCHSTVNEDTNEDTRDKYREVIGMNLCPDSHLCFICCYFLNKMCMFKSICLKRSLEYPVLFSEKGTINLQRSDITVAILCPEDICLQHLNTRYHFYNNSENSQSDFDDNNYCELQDERNFDFSDGILNINDELRINDNVLNINDNVLKINDNILKINDCTLKSDNIPRFEGNEEFNNEDYLFTLKDNLDSSFCEELNIPNLEPVRITQNDLAKGWTNNDCRYDRKKNDTVLHELQNRHDGLDNINTELEFKLNEIKIDNNLNIHLDNTVIENKIIETDTCMVDNDNENSDVIANNLEDFDNNNSTNNDNANEDLENTNELEIQTSPIESNFDLNPVSVSNQIDPEEPVQKSKRSKKNFEKIKLSVKEQKLELVQARREEKYKAASFKCYNCAMSFHFKDSYQAHMMRHEESNGEYRCSICSLRFANPAVLRSHAANHSERYKCTKCEDIVRARQRETHIRSCRSEKDSVTCHLCGSVFQGASHYQQHMKRFHQNKSSNRSYLCNVCGKSYNNRPAVRTHMITHINRKFICDQCNAEFSSPYTLNQHKKKHNAVEPELHYCVECKIGYNTRKSLLAHWRNSMAHKDSVYKCPVCDRVCPSVSALRSHTASVHAREKNLACRLCSHTYSTRKALVRHIRSHNSEEPKKTPLCHACGETFKSTGILKRHLKNVCEKDKIEEIASYFDDKYQL